MGVREEGVSASCAPCYLYHRSGNVMECLRTAVPEHRPRATNAHYNTRVVRTRDDDVRK